MENERVTIITGEGTSMFWLCETTYSIVVALIYKDWLNLYPVG
jgi:hypothetical protein